MAVMAPRETDAEEHKARSAFVRRLLQRAGEPDFVPAAFSTGPRKTIVQFWDDLERLPHDVADCIESWTQLRSRGYDVRLFDYEGAKQLIASRLGSRHENAYKKCYHPAMQSDYFRLCYILVEGGCYVDVDDVHSGLAIDHLFSDGRLKIQPLCYNTVTDGMVPPEVFTDPCADSETWIYYFNNNPMIAGRGHPIIERALANATDALERESDGGLPEIQSTTGPGNLTRTIFELAHENDETLSALLVLPDWEDVASSRWPLSYRHDKRNWRLSNRSEYRSPIRGHG
jgi:mannosyltransferase OCH1-like enzyme